MIILLVTIVHVIVCFFLIIVVLLQSGSAGDVAAAFGGQGSQTAFGPRAGATVLTKATAWATVIFLITSVTLSIYATRHTSGSVLEKMKPATQQQKAPAPTPAPQK